jgi:hypothetical protein
MSGSKLSIRTILGSVIGLLGLLLVSATVVALVGVFDRYGEAKRIAGLAPSSQGFFQSLQTLRLERGNGLTALKAEAPADAKMTDDIAKNRRLVEEGYAAGVKQLAGVELRGLSESLSQLKAAHDKVDALRPKLDAALRQKSAERDAAFIKDWPVVTQGLLDALDGTSRLVEDSMMGVDPMVDQLLTVKRVGWMTRTNVGAAVLRLLTGLSSGQGWTPEEALAYAMDRGKAAGAWAMVTDAAARPGMPKALSEAAAKAAGNFSGPGRRRAPDHRDDTLWRQALYCNHRGGVPRPHPAGDRFAQWRLCRGARRPRLLCQRPERGDDAEPPLRRRTVALGARADGRRLRRCTAPRCGTDPRPHDSDAASCRARPRD